MARMSAREWAEARADYEVRAMSFREIGAKFKVGHVTIADKAKKEKWEKGKTEQLINAKVLIEKEISTYSEQMRSAVREVFDAKMRLAEVDRDNVDIYARTRRLASRTLAMAEQGNGEALADTMRLLQVGNEAVKPTVKLIEIDKGKPEITINTSNQPRPLTSFYGSTES